MSDVRFGPASTKKDPHGQSWIIYSADKIPFCDKTGRLVSIRDVAWKPQQSHEILVFAYLPTDCSEEEMDAATDRVLKWGKRVGMIMSNTVA